MRHQLLLIMCVSAIVWLFPHCKDDKETTEKKDNTELVDPSKPDLPDDDGKDDEGNGENGEGENEENGDGEQENGEGDDSKDDDNNNGDGDTDNGSVEIKDPDPNDPFDKDGVVKAFPGAEGGAKYVTGGRGGKVLHVTSLKDDGSEGTLRWALSRNYPRIIVFDVSGIIELTKRLEIKYNDVTVAGQTAPGDGICIKNYSTYIGANNVILRFLRFRMGDEKKTEDDAIWGRNQKDIMIDHCSMSWSTDECSSFYNNENFTMQWCILGESLRVSVHGKGTHGYGGIWGGTYASFHHNVILHHDSRNPRLCGPRFRTGCPVDEESVDLRNNIFYNWGSNCGYAGEGGRYNFVNNYYKPGPASKSKDRFFQPYAYSTSGSSTGSDELLAGSIGLFYVEGNYMDGKGDNYDFSGIKNFKAQNNTVFYRTTQDGGQEECSVMDETTMRTKTMFELGTMTEINTHTAKDAYNLCLKYAGASFSRDAIDARYVQEIAGKTYTYKGSNGSTNGLIDSQTDVGGYPEYKSASKPKDTDNDGMPDAWEEKHGLNPDDASDAIENTLDSRYNNIEVYVNNLVHFIMKCEED